MKAIVESLSEIPDALRGEYEEREGKYVLRLEGDPPGFVRANDYGEMRDKVDRFRDNYTKAMKRAREIAGVGEGADMDEDLAPLQHTFEALKAKLEEASVDPNSQTLQDQIQRAIKPLQEKLDRSESDRIAAQGKANKSLLREAITEPLVAAGVRPSVLPWLLDQSEGVFQVKDDAVTARDGIRAESGDPLTPKDWVTAALREHDFAFAKSKGGGASPGNGSGGAGGAEILRNPTPEQLGRNMDAIASGKIKIVND